MISKFRAYLNMHKKIVDVQEINYKYKEIVWVNGKYTEVDNFSDIELMQSTGLFDKNGKEIYIGDILEYEMVMGFGWYENGKDVVVYDENELKIKTKYNNSLNRVVDTGCEVVGNIYQHPNLLEGDQ